MASCAGYRCRTISSKDRGCLELAVTPLYSHTYPEIPPSRIALHITSSLDSLPSPPLLRTPDNNLRQVAFTHYFTDGLTKVALHALRRTQESKKPNMFAVSGIRPFAVRSRPTTLACIVYLQQTWCSGHSICRRYMKRLRELQNLLRTFQRQRQQRHCEEEQPAATDIYNTRAITNGDLLQQNH